MENCKIASDELITDIDSFGKATLNVNNQIEIKITIPGNYQAFNALAALAVGHRFGVSLDEIKDALENHTGASNRLGIKEAKCKIIDDTYNANPESTLASIKTLAAIKTSGSKYFILGDMLELGENKEIYHSEMGKAIAETDIDYFFTHGTLTSHSNDAAKKAGHKNAVHFSTKKEMIDYLNQNLTETDIVLLKGSRSSKMEEIIEGLNK